MLSKGIISALAVTQAKHDLTIPKVMQKAEFAVSELKNDLSFMSAYQGTLSCGACKLGMAPLDALVGNSLF